MYRLLFALCICIAAFAQDFHPCEKQYVEHSQVKVGENEIRIAFLDDEILTSSLCVDEQGLYFQDFKREKNCGMGQWECKKCHRCIPNYYLKCMRCAR